MTSAYGVLFWNPSRSHIIDLFIRISFLPPTPPRGGAGGPTVPSSDVRASCDPPQNMTKVLRGRIRRFPRATFLFTCACVSSDTEAAEVKSPLTSPVNSPVSPCDKGRPAGTTEGCNQSEWWTLSHYRAHQQRADQRSNLTTNQTWMTCWLSFLYHISCISDDCTSTSEDDESRNIWISRGALVILFYVTLTEFQASMFTNVTCMVWVRVLTKMHVCVCVRVTCIPACWTVWLVGVSVVFQMLTCLLSKLLKDKIITLLFRNTEVAVGCFWKEKKNVFADGAGWKYFQRTSWRKQVAGWIGSKIHLMMRWDGCYTTPGHLNFNQQRLCEFSLRFCLGKRKKTLKPWSHSAAWSLCLSERGHKCPLHLKLQKQM